MKKKLLIATLFLLIGVLFSVLLDSYLRNIVLELYKVTSSDQIVFRGKNFHLFPSILSMAAFGVFFSLQSFFFASYHSGNFLKLIISVLIFLISVFGVSAIFAYLKIVQCTMCDAIVPVNYSKSHYGLIYLIASLIPSVLSVLIYLIAHKKK